ncbi:MAG: IclR family transcriptional regulator [Rubrivivax sp.]
MTTGSSPPDATGPAEAEGQPPVSPTQSLDRAIGLLDEVAGRAREGASLTELARATTLSKATAHRLLGGLKALGLVEYDAVRRRFHPGLRLYRMGLAAAAHFDIVDMARPSLERLAEETEDTVYLSLRVGDRAMCLARREGSFPIRTLTLNVGDYRPLGLGAGSLALLAFAPDDEVDGIVQRNRAALQHNPNFDALNLKHMVAEARGRGYAINDGLMLPEMAAIGVPVRDLSGRAVASLSVATIRSRMQGERRISIAQRLLDEARALEARLRGVAADGGAPK